MGEETKTDTLRDSLLTAHQDVTALKPDWRVIGSIHVAKEIQLKHSLASVNISSCDVVVAIGRLLTYRRNNKGPRSKPPPETLGDACSPQFM